MLHKELIDKLEETRTNAKKVVDMCDELLTGDFEDKQRCREIAEELYQLATRML